MGGPIDIDASTSIAEDGRVCLCGLKERTTAERYGYRVVSDVCGFEFVKDKE